VANIIPQERLTRKKLVQIGDRLVLPAIVVLVGIGSFGLGRLSALEASKQGLIIHPPGDANAIAEPVGWLDAQSATSDSAPKAADVPHNYLASKNGTKYYLPDCPGAKKIAVQNQIWFATAALAAAAGFEPAANCKGL